MSRTHLLIAVLALGLVLMPWPDSHADFHLRNPQEGEEVLGYIKADPNILRTQLDIAVAHLRNAITQLEGAPDVPAIQNAAHLAYLSYRMMRFATHGAEMLGTARPGRPFPNPIYRSLAETVSRSRVTIVNANLQLASAARWPEKHTAAVHEARRKLIQALALVEAALLLF